MDEKYFGGKPRYQPGVPLKKGSRNKHRILVAVQRKGYVLPLHLEKVKTATIMPVIDQFANPHAKLMTDKSYVFHQAGKQFSSHESVWHFAREYARGDIHINTAESFGSMLERMKTGVFHYISKEHLNRYLPTANIYNQRPYTRRFDSSLLGCYLQQKQLFLMPENQLFIKESISERRPKYPIRLGYSFNVVGFL
jgi:hypothetical protein